jgi:DNA-binding NarL/FixJ family response regulator
MKPPKKTDAAKRRVLVVDDHPIMREGLRQLINNEPDLVVCGESPDANEAMVLIRTTKPDIVLADISLPGKSGLEFIKDVRAQHPSLSVLVLSMHDESLYAERVLRAGARGYVMKQEGGRKVVQAIHQILGGQMFVSERMSTKILEIFSGRRGKTTSSPVELLTDREFEVFQLIGKGLATSKIAEQLHLSVKTIEVHRLHIKEKLKVNTAPELIRFAVRWLESEDGAKT